jgi:hypothetical protein
MMHRNPKTVRELKETIRLKESELIELKHQLKNELELVPVGYELIGSGDEVKAGALGYEPYHGNWSKVGNSVGKILNEQGYVTGITHRGWKYVNPV